MAEQMMMRQILVVAMGISVLLFNVASETLAAEAVAGARSGPRQTHLPHGAGHDQHARERQKAYTGEARARHT
ncbi:MAG: hypothetical protein QGG09_11030, partial [Pirellulaceae bacterium]|nr:hypothetical protein [Pirellulaceae bacterium]